MTTILGERNTMNFSKDPVFYKCVALSFPATGHCSDGFSSNKLSTIDISM